VELDPAMTAALEHLPPASWFPDYAVARNRALAVHAAILAPPDPRLVIHDEIVEAHVPIRIYRPIAHANAGALLFFHDGGYFMGDLNASDAECRATALALGSLVVSVDYRLAPEHPYPAATDDAYAVLNWLAANASPLDVDAARIALAGRSSGGGIAAATVLLARDRGGPAIAMQCLLMPMLDDRMHAPSVRAMDDPRILDYQKLAACWHAYLAGSTDIYAAPARAHDLAGLPPAFVHVAQADPLCDEGVEYAERLHAAGVPTELHLSRGVVHNFESHIPQSHITQRAFALRIDALRAALS
jgi:acetyl esterase